MKEVTLYSAHGCSCCGAAEQLLRRKGVRKLKKIQVDTESGQLERMTA